MKRFGGEVEDKSHRFIDFVTESLGPKAANVAALGHGAVFTYPDRPYLSWEFRYETERGPCVDPNDPTKSIRHNPTTFEEACEKLFKMYRTYLARSGGASEFPRVSSYSSVKPKIVEIIKFQGSLNERAAKWSEAFEGGFFGEALDPFPRYLGTDWIEEIDEAQDAEDADELLQSEVFKFYQAAEQHRAYVLRDLLPSYGLVVK